MKRILFFLLLVLSLSHRAAATAWDEPWAKEVITGATSFVLASVLSSDEDKGVTIRVIKTLGGAPLTDTIHITDFYLLRLCSSSGHGPEFRFEPEDSCYFFIQRGDSGRYSIATPTTGFSHVQQGEVIATYRHSYHQASVPVGVYEKTMSAVFAHHHRQPYDTAYMRGFVMEQLAKAPAGFAEEELSRFFLQHAALECVYHLQLAVPTAMLTPFLSDANFHNQVSGARALGAQRTHESRALLMEAVEDTAKRAFVRVICVWAMGEGDLTPYKARLQKLAATAPDEEDGFGGNIMDPRVCTHVPALKRALEELGKGR